MRPPSIFGKYRSVQVLHQVCSVRAAAEGDGAGAGSARGACLRGRNVVFVCLRVGLGTVGIEAAIVLILIFMKK